MIQLADGEFVVSGYINPENGAHFAITNRGKLWWYDSYIGSWRRIGS